MLTARGEETDRVLGLDLGADDYVTKPFSVRELLARVRALLRRTQTPQAALPDELRFDDVVIDFRRFEALKHGTAIEMTPKEFGILRMLAARVGEVVTRDDLLNGVWELRKLSDNANRRHAHRVAAGETRGESRFAAAADHRSRRWLQAHNGMNN